MRLIPAVNVHPMRLLNKEIQARKVHIAEFQNWINTGRDVTPEMAEQLERDLGIGKSFWLNLQSNYDQIERIKRER